MADATSGQGYVKPAGWYKRNEIAVTPWLFLIPAMFMFALYVIYPILQSFNISLYKWDGLGEAEYIGLANYEKLLTNEKEVFFDFWSADGSTEA